VHANLFRFLGGVPKFVVCDNLKAAVTNPDRYDPGINRTYAEMAGYYGTAILAARQGGQRTRRLLHTAPHSGGCAVIGVVRGGLERRPPRPLRIVVSDAISQRPRFRLSV